VRSDYLAGGAAGYGEAAPGDHLQTVYRFWLVGDGIRHGTAPWRDRYSFQPEIGPQWNPAGWPFGLPFWPLVALFGPVVAWNLFVLLTYVGAGGLTCLWLRALDLPLAAALGGGLAFALAPYRVQQSTGHLLGPISLLLPLALWMIERRRWELAAAALASIPLSGQVHLALGAIPLAGAYALARRRNPASLAGAALAVGAAIVAGLLVQRAVIAGSLEAGGRSLREVARYSAQWQDLVSRRQRHGEESFVFVGWLTPLLAAAGVAALVSARRTALAVVLAGAAIVPVVLALGTNLPVYETLWHHVGLLRYPRVPERLMPVACLALAALVAFAIARLRSRTFAAVVLAAVAVDLHVEAYAASAADPGNRAYAALGAAPPGRLLELPVFTPDTHFGSVYLAYDLRVRRTRPGGYSTLAPRRADEIARALRPLMCGRSPEPGLLDRLGVRYVAVHRGVYRAAGLPRSCPAAAVRELRRLGFRPLSSDGPISVFRSATRTGAPAAAQPTGAR
jgi:hypothetical protein